MLAFLQLWEHERLGRIALRAWHQENGEKPSRRRNSQENSARLNDFWAQRGFCHLESQSGDAKTKKLKQSLNCNVSTISPQWYSLLASIISLNLRECQADSSSRVLHVQHLWLHTTVHQTKAKRMPRQKQGEPVASHSTQKVQKKNLQESRRMRADLRSPSLSP